MGEKDIKDLKDPKDRALGVQAGLLLSSFESFRSLKSFWSFP